MEHVQFARTELVLTTPHNTLKVQSIQNHALSLSGCVIGKIFHLVTKKVNSDGATFISAHPPFNPIDVPYDK
jgi:hypothetical protein